MRTTYQVPGIYVFIPGTCEEHHHSSSSYSCRCSLQQVPRSHCCTIKVTPLESSHGHHLPARASPARAARGRRFDPKRAATAPECRACSAIREHRVGSLFGLDQTQAHSSKQQYGELVDNSSRWLTSTASSAPDAVLRVPG